MLHRYEFRAMGSDILAVVDSETRPPLLEQVPKWFEEWEQTLSRFRLDSELTRLNRIHEENVPVSATLWKVFLAAREAEKMTDGLATPTLLDAIHEAGYDRPFDELAVQVRSMPAAATLASPSLKTVTVDLSQRSLCLPSGMGLDFGGVAKGWAAHQSMKRLQAEGAALIDAGGDIAVSGAMSDGNPWPIGIADPFHPEEDVETLFVSGGGIATSGKDRRQWMRDGLFQHHIIDPSTMKPAKTDVLTVTVVAPDVMKAEAAAKAAFILGSRKGSAWIEDHADFAGVFILDDGQQIRTSRLHRYTKPALFAKPGIRKYS